MYRLVSPSGAKFFPETPCRNDDASATAYGCTYDTNKPYPFNSSAITLDMEGDTTTATDGSQQGYLHNVVAQEMTEGSTLASYTAQAIAARTYAYFQTNGGTIAIDNSASKQVYLPYRYEGLANSTRRQTVHNAITLPGALYMTLPGSLEAINAHFGQDNCTFTEQGAASYLKSVYDPISAKEGSCRNSDYGTGYGGLGSAGASRWGYGHTNEYNRDDLGDPWSVQWESGLLIPVHYYTDIVIRNASGQIVTPASRWNPLSVDWGGGSFTPPPMNPNGIAYVVIRAQNSGTDAWTSNTLLSYQWQTSGGSIINGTTNVRVGSVVEGSYIGLTLPVRAPGTDGVYTLKIDLIHSDGSYFHNREAGRPWFTLDYEVCVGSGCSQIFLPVVLKTTGSSGPENCQWTIDNLLEDGGFNNVPSPKWKEINVFVSPNEQNLTTLRTTARSAPGDGPWSAVLGGVNDTDNDGDYREDHELFEHAVFQMKTLPDNVDKVAIEYSYYLTTQESASTTTEWDKFFVDLQAGGLGLSNSLLGAPVKYSNLHPYKNVWRRRGLALEDGGDGLLVVDNTQTHTGEAIYLVFYSEVDRTKISTFYIDAVKLKGCTQ